MKNCFKCADKAIWICECSNIFICNDHCMSHLSQGENHTLKKLRFELKTEKKITLIKQLIEKNAFLDKIVSKIFEETENTILYIELSCKNIINRIDKIKKQYNG